MSKHWIVYPYDSSDKEIKVHCGDIRILVDFDDMTQELAEEAELLAEFISKQQKAFSKWRRDRETT